MLEIFLMAAILGLMGGMIPGPILSVSIVELLSPKPQTLLVLKYILAASLVEFLIGVFLIATAAFIEIPEFILYVFSIIGGLLLLRIVYKLWHIDHADQSTKKISLKNIAALTFFNGSLWIFWISVCVPTALKLKEISISPLFFPVIFEIFMVLGHCVLLLAFFFLGQKINNPKICHLIYRILAGFIVLISAKMMWDAVSYFIRV